MIWAVDAGFGGHDDDVLIRHCGDTRFVYITEDKAQRRNSYLVSVIQQANIGYILVRFNKASFAHKDHVYRQYLGSICELLRHPAPFCAVLTVGGFHFDRLDAHLTRRDGQEVSQAAEPAE